ncbi:MAG: hypothetical protein JWN79_941 [Gemmatimonadetes bacterium]|jgi:hypothetical protein|nr:hypothetical protein [Gemmatimonadota bacterium]
MPENPTDGGTFDADRYKNPETALGGADAVEKTSYVTGSGTEPETIKPAGVAANVPAGGGKNATWIIIGMLLVAAVLVYVLGFGR